MNSTNGASSTIEYYNHNAEAYFESTSQVSFDEIYEKFLDYVPAGGRIMDLGCGSGRDVKWFREHGYEAYGLDASEELVSKATSEYDIPVSCGLIEEWVADEPFDGIWCCASLMHLGDEELEQFFMNLEHNLKPGGAVFISVKSGVETGCDEAGRYFRNFTEEDITGFARKNENLKIVELWYTEDKLARDSFRWMNVIMKS